MSVSVVGAHSTVSASSEEGEALSIALSQESDSSAPSSAASSALGTPELTASGSPTGLSKPFAQFRVAPKKVIDKRDSDGETELMTAAFKGELDVVQKLLEAKAEVNAQDNDGATALHKAISGANTHAKAPHIAVVEALLKAKADVNLTDEGITPLAVANQAGNKVIIEMLRKSW
jgi:ankyrin repeat protein